MLRLEGNNIYSEFTCTLDLRSSLEWMEVLTSTLLIGKRGQYDVFIIIIIIITLLFSSLTFCSYIGLFDG